MATSRRSIGQDMLIAVNDLTQEINGTPQENTKKFWEAFGPFASEYLIGRVNVEISDDGRVVASFHPNK